MQVRRVGQRAVLIECADPGQVRAAYAQARRRLDATDVIPAARTVLVDGVDPVQVIKEVAGWDLQETVLTEGPLVAVPVSYDGPDLARVARHWKVAVAEVGPIHERCDFVVSFCGFAPGFAYCSGLPEELSVPRLSEPRSRVPSGSVGLAGTFTGVYPRESPGGWQLIGRTRAELWRPAEAQPALLAPGTRVRFVDA